MKFGLRVHIRRFRQLLGQLVIPELKQALCTVAPFAEAGIDDTVARARESDEGRPAPERRGRRRTSDEVAGVHV